MEGTPDFIDDRFPWRGHGWRRGRGGPCRGSWERWAGMEDRFPEMDPIDHHHDHHFRPHHHFIHGRGRGYAPRHFWLMRGCPPCMRFHAREGEHKMTNEESKVAEEGAKVASQIASAHVADIMKEMWNAWSEEFMTKEHIGTTEQSAPVSGCPASKPFCTVPVNEKDKQDNESKNLTQEETAEEPPSSEIPLVNLVKDMDNETPRKEIRRVSPKDVPPSCNDLIFVNQDGEISKRYKRKNSFSSQKRTLPLNETSSDSQSPGPISHADERVRNALAQLRDMGYIDEGGWLTQLLEMNNGDINKVFKLIRTDRKQ